jgi:uncharacterized membrane protein YdjX (TVP38/TMEM64 family)
MTSVEKSTPLHQPSRPRKLRYKAKYQVLQISRKWWFGIPVLILAIWGGWEFRTDLREYGEFILDQDRFSAYVRRLGIWGPALLWILNAIQILIAMLPGHAIALASGYIYGTYFGFIIVYTSTIVSGQIAFLLTRRYGRPLVVHFVPERILSRWDTSSEKHGFTYFLIALLVPVFPTDVLTYIAGLSMISTLKFTLANILGRAPYLFLISLVGAFGVEYLTQGLSPLLWLMVVLAMVVIYLAYKYMFPIISRQIFGEEK